MPCCICKEKIVLLPGPCEDEWLVLNGGLAHQSCWEEYEGTEYYKITGLDGKTKVKV